MSGPGIVYIWITVVFLFSINKTYLGISDSGVLNHWPKQDDFLGSHLT